MNQYVVALSRKGSLQATLSGGKGAQLAWMTRQSFPVPPGFVITTLAFQAFLASCGMQSAMRTKPWSEAELERIREQLMACPLPRDLTRIITRAYRHLGGRVAVRSSMVGEDSSLTSFAGQLDTILNVEGPSQLMTAVKRCWASLFNKRLFQYLDEREAIPGTIPFDDFSMAVVVQRMVDARVAGVAFSADPVSGQNCVIVEAVRGLGDGLVQGRVDPDRYVVDARGVLAETRSSAEGRPALDSAQVARLAQLVRDLARHFRDPQDIEWAWDGEVFHLIQCRPVTSLVGKHVYSNKMVVDMLPGLIKPLPWSIGAFGMLENIFGRILGEVMGPQHIDPRLLARRIHSRIYADTTILGELLTELGLPANFFEIMGRDERVVQRHPPAMSLRMLHTIWRVVRFGWRNARVADEIALYVERHDRALAPYRGIDWASESPSVTLAHIDQILHVYGETMWVNFIGPLNMLVRNRLLNHLVQKWAPGVAPDELVRGLVGTKALESHYELRSLAAEARALGPDVLRLLVEEGDEVIRAFLPSVVGGQVLLGQMDAFLARYGFLSAVGTDLSRTPWGESPTMIWKAIGRLAVTPGAAVDGTIGGARRDAQQRVRTSLNWMQRPFYDRLLASTLEYIRLREKTSLLLSQNSFEMRRMFLGLAAWLVGQGVLGEREEIFYLEYDEIRAWSRGN